MRAFTVKTILIGFYVVFASCAWGALPSAYAAETTQNDSFTAVAGTDDVVMDKRTKNNTTLISGLVIAGLVVLAVGAAKHAKSKINRIDESED